MSKKYPPQQLHISTDPKGPVHTPVLLDATLDVLDPRPGESYLDLTAGYGGHAREVIARTGAPQAATLVDRDENAILQLRSFQDQGARLLHQDFASAAEMCAAQSETFDMILIDLGVSSPQLDISTRGFSFRADGPLDMRMDPRLSKTAADIVNTYTSEELVAILRRYGEETPSQARHIASVIVQGRPFSTTGQLAEAIKQNYRGKWKKIHPATRTFQAIRIVVNDELGQIEKTLPLLVDLLKPGGRLAIISFHSLEDRLVKQFLKQEVAAGYEANLSLLLKKPVSGATEDVHNPRARSAKLRAAVKIKT